ncbi:ester cyclase [Rhodocytophaga aerolata]|uniref:Ester cyclase n=1 Tax=Rhodocytophaga aerolata TaxID=455078 RepID=A0ABT8RK94_9BACT|nr:ester cyclase [Rhodocytophaga aerolata]MDO1451480.1 ester cyclase [Rhodocytophaga aerolata]
MQASQIATYEHRWVEGLNRGDLSSADDAFAANCVIHINGSPEPNIGLEDFKEMLKGLLIAFPNLRFTIEDHVIAGDKYTTRWTAEATHTGPLGDIAPTGKSIRINGLILDRVVDDKVIE